MFLSDISVKRPIAMLCLIIGLTLLGLNSYRKMGVEFFPKMDAPFITIIAVYPGASPEQIEVELAKKIENQVVSISGLKHVTSSCMENVANILLEFETDVDVDIAATDVREKIDLIKSDLPDDAEDPQIVKFDVNAKPIVNLALTGNKSIEDLYDYADNKLRDKISVINGVADVSLIGGSQNEIQILLDRDKVASRGLTSLYVVNAIRNGIKTIPSGRVKDKGVEYTVEFKGEYDKLSEIGNFEICREKSQRCYIKDIARVKMTSGELRQKTFLNGNPAIAIKVVKKSDANAVRVVERVRKTFNKISNQLPEGMQLHWVNDDGRYIESSVNSAWHDVFQGILLTAVILFLFLYNVRTLIIVCITMPLTIIIGLFFMNLCGFTLNISTLLAIGMSVGILVTNSIVVLESIMKHFENSENSRSAAKLGAKNVGLAVLASAGTNMVVLFPIAMMDGIIVQFLKPLALTMLIMTAISLFISFTLTPLLASLILKRNKNKKETIIGKLEKFWNIGFQKFINRYRAFLVISSRRKIIIVVVLILIALFFFHSIKNFGSLGFNFVPKTDMAQLLIKLEFPIYYTIEKTESRVRDIEQRIKGLPELKSTLTTIGKVDGVIGKSSEGVYLAQIILNFTDKDKRDLSLAEIMEILRPRLKNIPDCIIAVNLPSPIGGAESDLEMEFSGGNLKNLNAYATQLKSILDKKPGFKDVDISVRPGKPKLRVTPKRAVLSDMGVVAVNLGLILRSNLEGITAGVFKRADRSYDIVVKYSDRLGKNQIGQFLFPGPEGKPVMLESFSKVNEIISPVQITRQDKERISRLYCNLKNKPLGTAANEISNIIDTKMKLPPGYNYRFAGKFERMVESQTSIGEAGITAIILLILTLAAILESYKQPFLILLTLPLTIPGIYWGLHLMGYSISFFVSMAVVMLIGIVVNNAILIIDEYNSLIVRGLPKKYSINKASVDQIRPIIMITMAAVLGMLPLALSRGIGCEFRNDIGTAAVGGILISGLLTMIVIPFVFNLLVRKKNKK